MAGVDIKYKDATIATIQGGGSKTLKTGGKYCEDDITVDYVKEGITPSGTQNISENGTYDVTQYASANVNVSAEAPTLITKSIAANGTYNASSDNADGYSDVVVNVPVGITSCITATFTVTSPFANQGVTLISGNSFIAANYNNSKAFALVVKVSDLSMNGINMAFCTNQQFGVLSTSNNTPVFGWFNGNTGTVSATANRIVNSLSTQNTTVGNMYANSNGDLVLRVGGGTNAFQTGNYFIIFGLME